MDILVVSACSGTKQYEETPLGCADIDSTNHDQLLEQHPEFVASASEMYTGAEHQEIQSAVQNLREHANVTWEILSAGYGLLAEHEEIVAYDCTLSDIDSVRGRVERFGHDPGGLTIDETRQTLAREKGMIGDLRNSLAEGYDIVFVVLSEPYLAAVSEALSDPSDSNSVFVLASTGSKQYVGAANWIPATREIREELGTTWFRLRGKLLWTLSKKAESTDLVELSSDPEAVSDIAPPLSSPVAQN